MSAKRKARKEFEKEQELEKLREKKERKEAVARDAAQKLSAKLDAMSPEEKTEFLRKQAKQRKIALIVVLVAVGLFVVAIFSSGGDTTDTESQSTPNANAVFSGKILSTRVINPATLQVKFEIENTGTDAGVPSCIVSVQDASRTYKGFDSPIFDYSIEPNSSISGAINLTVTKEGAYFVTQGDVTCS
jgi:hypothetical protein